MKRMNSMKNFVKFLPLLSGVLLFSGCEKESVIPETELPTEASTFISTHFSNETVTQVIKEKDDWTTNYDVILANGLNLEFTKNGECRSIEGGVELPESVIPSGIQEYVKQHYTDHYIVKWEQEKKEQDVEISNGLELTFDESGQFVRIDD